MHGGGGGAPVLHHRRDGARRRRPVRGGPASGPAGALVRCCPASGPSPPLPAVIAPPPPLAERGGSRRREEARAAAGARLVSVCACVRVCVVARSDGDDEEDCECTSGGQVDVPCSVDADCRPPGCGLSAPVDPDDEGASNAAAIAHLVAAAAICAMVLIPGIVTACGVPERPQFTQKRGCTINVGLCGRSRAEREAADRARRVS
eukprot:COSAG01_NODE_146_length_24099_cov_25.341208_9_plen_205_part_00